MADLIKIGKQFAGNQIMIFIKYMFSCQIYDIATMN